MKKFVKSALVLSLLSSCAMAEVIFDLGAQQLSNSVDGNYVDATYDAGDSIVSTGLAHVDGYYRAKEQSTGHFGVQVKQPQSQWAVSFNMYVYIDAGAEGSSLILTSSSGQAVNIYIDYNKISVAGTTMDADTSAGKVISGSIEMNGNTIDIVINGSYEFHVEKPNFKLEQFNMILATESSTFIERTDKLNNLTISTSN